MICSITFSATSASASEPTPCQWGCLGMFSLFVRPLLAVALLAPAGVNPESSMSSLLDFGKNDLSNWRGLNDDVMGGRSRCTVKYSKATLSWEGTVSLENNGGFSSVRSTWKERDLSAFEAVTLRCRTTTGVPDDFTLTMEVSEKWWMPYWKTNFDVQPEWTEITIPFSKLKKSSAMTGELPKLWTWGDLSAILRMGFMKYDGQAGDFGLEVDWMRFSGAAEVRN